MVRHIVIWNHQERFTPEQKLANACKVKADLEALSDVVEGIVSLRVIVDPLPSSNRDVVLNSLFSSEEALQSYQVHPDHRRVSSYVGSVLCGRACIDYIEE